MSELSSEIPLGPLYTPEEHATIEAAKAKIAEYDPTLVITDDRILQMEKVMERYRQMQQNSAEPSRE